MAFAFGCHMIFYGLEKMKKKKARIIIRNANFILDFEKQRFYKKFDSNRAQNFYARIFLQRGQAEEFLTSHFPVDTFFTL